MVPQSDPSNVLSRYAAALHRRDLDAVVACFAADAVVLAPSSPVAVGPQVRQMYQGIVDAYDLNIEFTVEDAVVQEQKAALFTTSAGSRTTLADATVSPVHSREAFVLVRDREGWLIGRYLFNRT